MKTTHPSGVEFIAVHRADPGHYVLDVLTGNGTIEPIKHLVLFWALEAETLAPYPVTLEGVQTDNVCILEPCGKVEQPCIGGYANMDDWLAGQKAKYAREIAR